MNIVVIGLGFYQRHLVHNLKDRGFYIIGIDGDSNPFCRSLVDEFFHIDVKNVDEIIETLKDKNIEGVFSVASDITLEATSKITSQFGLRGMGWDVYQNFKFKDYYYNKFAKLGVNVPKTYKIQDVLTLPKSRYIVKPSCGAGNRGVKILDDIHEFDFENHEKIYYRDGETHIIQEYIDGQKHILEAICYQNKLYPLLFSESHNRKGSSLSDEIHFSTIIDNSHAEDLFKYTSKICKTIPSETIVPMHMEFISNEDGIYLIDFSLRGGGYDIFTSVVQKVTNYDLLTNYIDSILGVDFQLPVDISHGYAIMNLIYSDINGIIEWSTSFEDLSNDHVFVKCLCENGSNVNIPKRDSDRIAYIICYDESYENVNKMSNHIESKLNWRIIE